MVTENKKHRVLDTIRLVATRVRTHSSPTASVVLGSGRTLPQWRRKVNLTEWRTATNTLYIQTMATPEQDGGDKTKVYKLIFIDMKCFVLLKGQTHC